MVIKLDNVADWQFWQVGKLLDLPSDKLRKVRLEVNCVEPTAFHLVRLSEPEGTPHFFLAVVHGHEVIEVAVSGDVLISATGEAPVWFFTSEREVTWADAPDGPAFVEVVERRARNPELELMQFKMTQNMARRFAQMEADMMARVGAAGAINTETGEVTDDGEDGDGLAARSAPKPAGKARSAAPVKDKGKPAGTDGDGSQAPAGDRSGEQPSSDSQSPKA